MPNPIAVPKKKVGPTVQSFITLDNIQHMEITRQENGLYLITPLKSISASMWWRRISNPQKP